MAYAVLIFTLGTVLFGLCVVFFMIEWGLGGAGCQGK
jgi:hypothetical protein